MSLSDSISNSSASVALRLLTDAAAKSSKSPNGAEQSKTSNAQAPTASKSIGPSSGSRIILSIEAAERAYGADSFLMQTAKGKADQVEVTISSIPSDKTAYKKTLFEHMKTHMTGDPDFMAALKAGKVTILTADEIPELNFQPTVSFTMMKNGASFGSGLFTPSGFNHGQLQEWEATRGQVVFGDAYAYYDKPVS